MALQMQPSPELSLDNSPAESFLSTPGDHFPSLFSASSPSVTSPSTINPLDMMTPQSTADDKAQLSSIPEDDEVSVSASDKKQSKKRKSWGQVLPEPKTNLPPRKRAKTDDEKEQRRVERVLRNRRAAQSSRERKRLEVEALELRNNELESMLNSAQQANVMLMEELKRLRGDSGAARASSSLDSMRDDITLSQELFKAQNDLNTKADSKSNLLDQLVMSSANRTVNPASLSPELRPVTDSTNAEEDDDESCSKPSEVATAPSSDLTQYPAAMLCDLQCQSSEEQAQPLSGRTLISPLLALMLQLQMLMLLASTTLSACQRPLAQIAMSSKAGFSLVPSPLILTTIIRLVTSQPASPTTPPSSTSMTSSTTRQTMSPLTLWQRATTPLQTTSASSRKYMTLRLKSLRKILSSSPNLARPLCDATMVALRLVSEGRDDRVGHLPNEPSAMREVDELTKCLSSIQLPPKEVLLTLLWTLKLEERKTSGRQNEGRTISVRPAVIASKEDSKPIDKHVIKLTGMKRRQPQSERQSKRRQRSQ